MRPEGDFRIDLPGFKARFRIRDVTNRTIIIVASMLCVTLVVVALIIAIAV